MSKKECKHEEWNPCGNDFYSCRKCGILRTSQQVNLYEEKDKKIADLEAKLAEKDKAIENWHTMYQSVMQSCHNVIEEDKRLREQLAEKDKQYQELLNSIKIKDLSNINFIQVNEDIVRFSESGFIYEYNKKDNTIYKIIDKAHQDKISFCIEQLEKVKEFAEDILDDAIKNCSLNESYYDRLLDEIDNQIEELKKEMK